MSSLRRTRNTNLLRARGLDPARRELWDKEYERYPVLRPSHVAEALLETSPLRTKDFKGRAGYSTFELTADGRTYTVLVLAHDPEEWYPSGIRTLSDKLQGIMRPVWERWNWRGPANEGS